MMFIRLCDIANPVIVPEVINVQGSPAEGAGFSSGRF